MTHIAQIPAALWARLDPPRLRLLAGTRAGEILTVTVTGRLSERRVLLDIKGLAIAAFTRIPLRVGETLRVEVATTADGITLRPVAPEALPNKLLARVLASPGDAQDLARSVENLARNPVLDLPAAEFPALARARERLVELVRSFGLDAGRLSDPAYLGRVLERFGVRVEPPSNVPSSTAVQPGAGAPEPATLAAPQAEQAEPQPTPAPTRPATSAVFPKVALPAAAPEATPPEHPHPPVPPMLEDVTPRVSPPRATAVVPATPETAASEGTSSRAGRAVLSPPVEVVSLDPPAAQGSRGPETRVLPDGLTPARDTHTRSAVDSKPQAATEPTPERRSPAESPSNSTTVARPADGGERMPLARAPLPGRSSSHPESDARRAAAARQKDPDPQPISSRLSRAVSTPEARPAAEATPLRTMPRELERVQAEMVRALRTEGARALAQSSPADLENLLATVKQLGQSVERMGLLNGLAPEERPLFLEIPFWSGGEVHAVKIRLHDRRKKDRPPGREGEVRFDVFFDLSGLGRLRVDTLYHKGGVSVTFIAESREAAAMLERDLAELRGKLDADGVRVHALRVEHRVAVDPQAETVGDIVTLSTRGGLSLKG